MKMPILFKQTVWRSSAIFLVKSIGLIGRANLSRFVGTEGIGMFQLVYAFYGFMHTAITGGFPTTLALTTAKDPILGWRLFKLFSMLMLAFGGALSFATFRYSAEIAQGLGNAGLEFAVRCIAPSLVAAPMLALFRGYLQGRERFGMVAGSELAEQSVRIGIMLAIVYFLLPSGHTTAIGGGMLGTLLGALAAFCLLIILAAPSFESSTRLETPIQKSNYGLLIQSSMLIAATKLLIPASDLIDAVIIQKRLRDAGFSEGEAIGVYGAVAGMAVILAYMPTLVTAALSHTLTIKITGDWQKGKTGLFNERVNSALEFGWLWGWTSALFLFAFSSELSWLFFGTEDSAAAIRFLSFIPLIVGIRELTTSILWAQDRRKAPLLGLIAGISLSFAVLYYLLAVPGLEDKAIAMAILAMESIAAIWNMRGLLRNSLVLRVSTVSLMFDVLIVIGIFAALEAASRVEVPNEAVSILLKMAVYIGMVGICFVHRAKRILSYDYD